MNKNEMLAPAYPTHPVQDQFQRVIMATGLSKIELFTLTIAAHLAASHSEKFLPETIAEEAYSVALSTFEKLQEEFLKLNTESKSMILDGKGGPESKL